MERSVLAEKAFTGSKSQYRLQAALNQLILFYLYNDAGRIACSFITCNDTSHKHTQNSFIDINKLPVKPFSPWSMLQPWCTYAGRQSVMLMQITASCRRRHLVDKFQHATEWHALWRSSPPHHLLLLLRAQVCNRHLVWYPWQPTKRQRAATIDLFKPRLSAAGHVTRDYLHCDGIARSMAIIASSVRRFVDPHYETIWRSHERASL